MKELLSLCMLTFLIGQLSFAQIWRVNNVTGVSAGFLTAQEASIAAADGGTIHFELSSSSYDDLLLSKQLYIISTGNFLLQNPGFQQSITPGFLGNIKIYDTGAKRGF